MQIHVRAPFWKSEIRRSKSERNPKSETRIGRFVFSVLRVSDFLSPRCRAVAAGRASEFGLRIFPQDCGVIAVADLCIASRSALEYELGSWVDSSVWRWSSAPALFTIEFQKVEHT